MKCKKSPSKFQTCQLQGWTVTTVTGQPAQSQMHTDSSLILEGIATWD